ncbi:MAG: phosphoribosyltransferase family protein [Nanoarchaeota archaeon]
MVSPVVEVDCIPPTHPSVLYEPSNPLSHDLDEILLTNQQILARVDQLARDIGDDYKGRIIQPVVVMDGAHLFYKDLVCRINSSVGVLEPLLIKVKSYDGDYSTGRHEIRLHKDSKVDLGVVKGSDLLFIEDIIDTGMTIDVLGGYLNDLGPGRVCGAVLLDKPSARKVEPRSDLVRYTGFRIPKKFVVGYGLDYRGQLRGEPHIGVLAPDGQRRIDLEVAKAPNTSYNRFSYRC